MLGAGDVFFEEDGRIAERAPGFRLCLVEKLGTGQFDVIVFGDVLEHLRDPLPVLRASRALLPPDTTLQDTAPPGQRPPPHSLSKESTPA